MFTILSLDKINIFHNIALAQEQYKNSSYCVYWKTALMAKYWQLSFLYMRLQDIIVIFKVLFDLTETNLQDNINMKIFEGGQRTW